MTEEVHFSVDKDEVILSVHEICEEGQPDDFSRLQSMIPETYRGEWVLNVREKLSSHTPLHTAIIHR